ncbi:MAG: LSU ribosomal protein L32p [Candidatus Kapaibacterium sp.]|nr:MAG: LSU ribosomal protein L32p [Candidatus Kapabacteria bacterium]
MPNPKRRMSSLRRDKRRAHYKPTARTTSICPQCGAAKLPHRACPECGYYNGRKIISKV